MKRLISALTASLGLHFALMPAAPAATTDYQFTTIAREKSPAHSLGVPVINNHGTVAFTSRDHHDLQVTGSILTDHKGRVTAIVDNVPGMIPDTSINDNGYVAFARSTPEGISSIVIGNGGSLTTIATPTAALGQLGSSFNINNRNEVAFITSNGIFVGNGGPPVSVWKRGQTNHIWLGAPYINDRGTVVFSGARPNMRPTLLEVLNTSLSDLGVYYPASWPVLEPIGMSPFPVVNNKGTIAFQASISTGPDAMYTAIYTSAAGSVPQAPLPRIVDATGMAPDIGAVLSINDNGTVAFQGTLHRGSESSQGIFTGPDPIADRVIVVGDSLCGSKVTGLDLSREALSDSGELTFRALLEDGSRVIVRATPVAESRHR